MPILNSFSGSGGGVRIPLESPTEFTVLRGNASNTLSWVDPVDKVATPGGETVSTWAYDILVRRPDRYPAFPTDGYPVFRNTVRNQGGSRVTYVDENLENGVTYYYALYSYTTIGAVSEGVFGSATPTAGVVHAGVAPQTLVNPDQSLAAATVGNGQYVIFAGGYAGTSAFDSSWTRISVSGVGVVSSVRPIGAASTTNNAIFHQSQNNRNSSNLWNTVPVIDVYTSSLTHSNYTDQNLGVGAELVAGCGLNGNAIFGGGYGLTTSTSVTNKRPNTRLCSINDSLTQTTNTISALSSSGRYPCGMVPIGNYALLGPGQVHDRYDEGEDGTKKIFAISSSLTQSATRNHSGNVYTWHGAAFASSETYAILAGGDLQPHSTGNDALSNLGYGDDKRVSAFNTALTQQAAPMLPDSYTATAMSAGASVGEYVVFAGGSGALAEPHKAVVAYDSNLVQTIPEEMTSERGYVCGISFGSYAVFAGGTTNAAGSRVNTIELYTT